MSSKVIKRRNINETARLISTKFRTKNYKLFRSHNNDPNINLLNTDLTRFVINN